MDRTTQAALDHLRRAVPSVLPLTTLLDRLRADRVVVTASVLERSLRALPHLRLLDPGVGANRGLPGGRPERCMVLVGAEREGPRSGLALTRAVDAVGAAADPASPCAMARWRRLTLEAQEAIPRARALEPVDRSAPVFRYSAPSLRKRPERHSPSASRATSRTRSASTSRRRAAHS